MNSVSEADLTILYGSQTGNAEFLAFNISEEASRAGITAELMTLEDALGENNLSWQRLLIVTATHDNGHMPDNAEPFWAWLQTCEADAYTGLPYAVLAIGDSMYEDFCKAGQDFDGVLSSLGANPILPRMECDVDYDMTAGPWIKRFLAAVETTPAWSPAARVEVDAETAQQFATMPEEWREATVHSARELTGPGSHKRVVHFDIEIPEGFVYKPGDSIDVRPHNSPQLVSEWLSEFPSVSSVIIGGTDVPLSTALAEMLELRLPHIGLVNALLGTVGSSPETDEVRNLLDSGDRARIDDWFWGRDVLDVVKTFGFGRDTDRSTADDAQVIVDLLRPLQHRSYSIASSQSLTPNHLSLTVSAVDYEANNRRHRGAGTSFLETAVGSQISVRRLPSHDFTLPADEAPVIMIGPGVGVAPFISFIQELEHRGSHCPSWLFFGDQRRKTDWLYKDETQRWLASGVLSRVSLAFSRDQRDKHYVQHEILAHAAEFRAWVDRGAHIFVCGDKNRMAHDVEQALTEVLSDPAGSYESGARALEELRAAGRYAKDVY